MWLFGITLAVSVQTFSTRPRGQNAVRDAPLSKPLCYRLLTTIRAHPAPHFGVSECEFSNSYKFNFVPFAFGLSSQASPRRDLVLFGEFGGAAADCRLSRAGGGPRLPRVASGHLFAARPQACKAGSSVRLLLAWFAEHFRWRL